MKKAKQCVLVTTEHRGVFFGELVGTPTKAKATLAKARMCVYWSRDLKGVLGLAISGPSASCRVGMAVPKITLYDVTSVTECSPEAVKAWESAPWQ